ncbi:DarT ssDNA thymidine ADP-ribosyltransferase family protein [Acinetobacter variabilis]|uniref:DarT ssDNA thymidine ADP-ribosyltransferase family protein n=1 Tax=Acinetobacter variabilis TaxID=70346 RepID=UPI001BB514E6|nr:DarT ssDNA thymidine ADP-ribosyltransferase family protein [Acinetobacter variabilis]BCT88755.1 hypothetical protein RYU24_11600 [Acinetobacter variabilis]
MLAFHFTHIDNLESILVHGLLSTNLKNKMAVEHQNVANNYIQQTRSQIIIDNDLKLRRKSDIWLATQIKHNLHDFVPFYFAYKCPMLFQILTTKNIDQSDIIFIAIDAKKCLAELNDSYFSDCSINRLHNLPNLYSNEADLEKLNWAEIRNLKGVAGNDNLKQQRMAEFLIKDRVLPNYIEKIIVWNNDVKQKITDLYNNKNVEPPKMEYAETGHHYYLEPENLFGGRAWSQSAVLGPRALLSKLVEYYQKTLDEHKKNKEDCNYKFRFKNLSEMYSAMIRETTVLPEVADAYSLKMNYGYHKSTVQEHSCRVHKNLHDLKEFRSLNANDQLIAKLASLLHDIGKGPASRWKNSEMTRPDFNHSARSLAMLLRIFSSEIEELTEDEVAKIFVCVTYDDLIGEIVGKGRDKQQLFKLVDSADSADIVNLLFAIGKADMKDVHEPWLEEHEAALDTLYKEAIQRVEQNA